ncbi:hypothetical protein [Rhodococcus sp. BE178]|uniref:hypothetical protein n=1 Tax=Rhodococcus sp. BE178 TaxID=2817737 RepID=UPI003D256263
MTIEFQHITGAWMITDYDSPDDADALPEQVSLKGRVVFCARFDAGDRSKAIHVPDAAGNYLLSVREMMYPVVHGRLKDRQARDGVMLPAVVGGVPIVWTAIPELEEDPGVGIKGAKVPANTITFSPAEPDANGDRKLNLADVADASVEYPEPVVSRVAELVREAVAARDGAEAAKAAAEVARDGSVAAKDDAAGYAGAALANSQAAADSKAAAEAAKAAAEVARDGSVAAKDDAQTAKDAAEAARDAALAHRNTAGTHATNAGNSATAAEKARDDSVEAAGIAVASAEFADTRATAADASAVAAAASAAEAAGTVPEATPTVSGKIKLAGDLGGTAEAPAVPAVQSATPNATAGTLAKRDSAGALSVGTPTAAGHAVTKSYTDTALAKKANLDANGKIPQADLPAIAMVDFLGNVASQAAMLALAGQRGDWCNRTDLGTEWQLIAEPSTSLSSWMQKVYPASDVTSVAGRKGAVTLSSSDISDTTATGRAVMKAADAAAARTAIGALAEDVFNSVIEMLGKRMVEDGAWNPAKYYNGGEVVTYNHGRYYCNNGHAASATFPAANFVWLGLAAVASATDPGGGRLWVKI